jgi:two-component system cell cycle sensor histidine kinase/response regulator CckA
MALRRKSMGVQSADPVAAANGSKVKRPWSIKAYVVGLVVVFVLASGSGLIALARTSQLSGGLIAITLTGLVVFLAAALAFYRRIARPIAEVSAAVRAAMTQTPAIPITVTGPAEVASLVHDVNQMIARAEADSEATARLSAIVESSAVAIIGGTLDGVITSWNAGAEHQYGYAADEVIGHNVSELIPPGRADELSPIYDCLRRGEWVEPFETKHVCKDGTVLDVSVCVSPIRDSSGAVVGVSTVARNMTARIRAGAGHPALGHRQHEYERLQSLGQMAGAVAHDFNNLLAIIMKHADFLAEETTGRPAVQADVERIQVAAQRAARITRQLLVVGQRETAQPEALELNGIVAHMRDLLSTTVGTGIEIQVEAAADLPAIEADRGQVEQVILNLAVNARDAMPQGGTLTIETGLAELDERQARMSAVSAGRYVELTVSDTGTGMSADFAAHIFEPLFTTKPVGQGNGLGLATVHAIVTGAGGGISVFSEEGTGTTLRLMFPAAGTAAPAKPTADVTEPGEPDRRSSLSTR